MKKIIIYRHAKASHNDVSISDFERPLSHKGTIDAERMALVFEKTAPLPDLILCSTAVRTLQTIAPMLTYHPEIDCHFTDSLYLASKHDIIKLIETVPNSCNFLLLCGHNPGLTDFINATTTSYLDALPTASIVVMEFNTQTWKNLSQGRIVYFESPKE